MGDAAKGNGWEVRWRDLRDAVTHHVLRYNAAGFLPFFIERARLVGGHEAAVADHVGGQDCGKATPHA